MLQYSILSWLLRQGSNERDSSSATVRSSPVMLSAAKDLAAARDRPFAAKDLAAARDRPFAALRVTGGDCSNGQIQFVQIEPCLSISVPRSGGKHSYRRPSHHLSDVWMAK